MGRGVSSPPDCLRLLLVPRLLRLLLVPRPFARGPPKPVVRRLVVALGPPTVSCALGPPTVVVRVPTPVVRRLVVALGPPTGSFALGPPTGTLE